MGLRAAADIGGTFTDVVTVDEGGTVAVGKALSTPGDLLRGILNGLADAGGAPDDVELLLHGSTVVINALIERRGSRAALVTTEGFRDVYEIGRVNRPDAFNLAFRRPRPLIERDHVYEVPERLRADGTVVTPLDEDAVRALAGVLRERAYEAVGVVLLHSYRDPSHEIRVGEILRDELPGVFLTLSHELSREYREYERTSTVAANAFVGPIVSEYLDDLAESFSGEKASIGIMQSNGGLAGLDRVRRQSIQMVESGPAGGVVGTIQMCERLGLRDAIAFDMGGTTAKASVIRDLSFPLAAEYYVGGYAEGLALRVPCLDIVEVGTGGGSIAAVDAGGEIRVGPRSAGSEPGPACYGRGGTDATVTDACVMLGILDGNSVLSGGLQLDGEAARRAVGSVADDLGMDPIDLAAGIVAIAAASMANAVRAVTTERGLNPQDFAMFAYGGNGPVHATLVARELGIRRVVIPTMPSVFSAVGMLLADLRNDVVQTELLRVKDLPAGYLRARLEQLGHECAAALEAVDEAPRHLYGLDMRYVGQEHVLTLEVEPDIDREALTARFHTEHRGRFGHSAVGEPVEIVGLRASALQASPSFTTETLEPGAGGAPAPEAVRGSRGVRLTAQGEPTECAVYDRTRLRAGDVVIGPAVIEETTTTTLLREGDRLVVDATGCLLIEIGGRA
ncbi:hydantoinase/oxoprolinase family protein [Microbacterium testaceum]|uniref:hydantoinase/oxoprolinase family protein n=1 Tax=Microbacterium testaceum TaxID=2033 RepID=UPI0012450E1D|nr:hydantoinase/oxoprolinase family protein [Microbacterium testaceum]